MAGWVREYKYRRALGGTHDEYMDTPEETIEAMIRIHDAYNEAENRRNSQSSGSSAPQIS